MRPLPLALAALLTVCAPAFAQHEHEHENHGDQHGGRPMGPPPQRGPEPYRGNPHGSDEHRGYADRPGHPNYPHVDDGRQWVGHDEGRDDRRFHEGRPYEHGRYEGGFGPEHRWRMEGGDARRFRFHDWYWRVAPWEMPYVDDWDWDADDVVIYEDPDHRAGTWPTIRGWAHMCTCSISGRNKTR